MTRFAFALLLASSAFSQEFDRVFRLTGKPMPRGQDEIGVTLRVVADISRVSIDRASGTVTVHGSANQIALAEWLIARLDHAAPGPQTYQIAGNPNDVILVYPLTQVKDPRALQEVITTLRTVGDVQKVYNISATYQLALRGTANQVAMVNFLLPELDRAPRQREASSTVHFHIDGAVRGFDTLSVYGLAHATDDSSIQQVLTALRSVADMMKIYNVTANATFAMCANQTEIQTAEWLLGELDRESPNDGSNELKIPGGKDDAIHVFYLRRVSASKDIMELLKAVRSGANVTKTFWTDRPAALIVRGTANSLSIAARMVEQAEAPAP